MRGKRFIFGLATLGLVALSFPGLGAMAAATAQSSVFADPAFQATWARTDQPVASRTVSRSWYWGPVTNSGPVMEDYDQGPNGKHMVQYFDKTRMEINNPNG